MKNIKQKPKEWQPKTNWQKLIWTSHTEYVDIETGEQLKKKQIQNGEYIKITIAKDYKIEKHRPKGHIEYTIICEKNKQQKLF